MAKKHILIVDDQKEILLLLSSALETLPYNFQISLARSGEEALLEATINHVDLLIADIILPGMDGFEVMQTFQKNHPECKIVLISGVEEESIKRQIAQAGASAFFFKPIVLSDFLDTIERTLGLVDTFLPKEIDVFKKEAEEENIEKPPALIATLLQEFHAECVLLINNKGDIVSGTGSLPFELKEINKNQELLSMIFSKVTLAHSLKSKLDNNMSYLKINEFFIGLSALTSIYGLITLCKTSPNDEKLSVINEIQTKLRLQLSSNTDELIINKQEEKPVTEELIDERMEETLSSPKITTDALESFWEDAAEESPISNDDQGLSYEQAKILGLTPQE